MSREINLSELSTVHHTQIEFDGEIIPIKIDIADITEMDYILAYSFMNEFKVKKIKTKEIEHNELDDIKIVSIINNTISLSYEKLAFQNEIDFLEQDKRIRFCTKFINTTDKLFDGKTLLEYLEIDDVLDWLNSIGMTDTFYNELYGIVSFWIDNIIDEFQANVKVSLLLNDEDGKVMNHNLSRLKMCYDTLKIPFFKENESLTTFENLSYREQHLIQSYATKMNYIDIAINKENKAQFEERKTNNRRSSSRGKF